MIAGRGCLAPLGTDIQSIAAAVDLCLVMKGSGRHGGRGLRVLHSSPAGVATLRRGLSLKFSAVLRALTGRCACSGAFEARAPRKYPPNNCRELRRLIGECPDSACAQLPIPPPDHLVRLLSKSSRCPLARSLAGGAEHVWQHRLGSVALFDARP